MPEPQPGFDWQQLLRLLPMAVAGFKGGMPAAGGFASGYAGGLAQREEEARRQRAEAARAAAEQYAQQRDLVGDQRYDEQQRQEKQARVMRLLESLPAFGDRALQEAEGAGVTDPGLMAEHATKSVQDWMATLGQVMPDLGVDPAVMARAVGDLRPKASQRVLAKVDATYKRLTEGLDDRGLQQLRADPRPLALGMPFAEMERLYYQGATPPERTKSGSPQLVETIDPKTGQRVKIAVTPREGMEPIPVPGPQRDPLAQELAQLRIDEMRRKRDVQIQDLTPAQQRLVNTLSGQYEAASKNYFTQVEQFAKIKAISESPAASAADDISFIFAYMKLLDPTSVVREGEFATAQNATGVPDRVRNAYNQLMKGNRLNPQQRKDFTDASRRIYQGSKRVHDQLLNVYGAKAKRLNVPSDLVVYDLDPEAMAAPTTGTIRIKDPQGNIYEAPAGTPIPAGYTKVGG